MKKILGSLIIIFGICLGLYLGIWVMLIGGIIQIIQNCTPIINTIGIALGLLRIICASFVGWISFYISFGIGYIIFNS